MICDWFLPASLFQSESTHSCGTWLLQDHLPRISGMVDVSGPQDAYNLVAEEKAGWMSQLFPQHLEAQGSFPRSPSRAP